MTGKINPTAAKYGVKCPKCGSREIWKVGFVPVAGGRKDRFKCTVCAASFYKGQPGTVAGTVSAKPKASRKKKAG